MVEERGWMGREVGWEEKLVGERLVGRQVEWGERLGGCYERRKS